MSSIDLLALTLSEIRTTARQKGFAIPRSAPTRKEDLLLYISQHASANIMSALTDFAREKEGRRLEGQRRSRQEEVGQGRPAVRRRLEEFRPVKPRHAYDQSKYLDLPTADEVKACYRHFYEATCNNALKMVVCAVCAREVGVQEDNVIVLPLRDLPNAHRLVPRLPHRAHHLFEGKLLEPAGVQVDDEPGRYKVNICCQCRSSLENEKCNLPPAISLANDMWIGRIPEVLSSLTFPEQLLISHLYPRVYVFKLYPKKGFGGDPSKLQKGMRGTVSTFQLDMQGITSMLEGNLMPRRPALLASIISVTYIGLGRLPKQWLRHLFRVRRSCVLSALEWLKENNAKYYGQVTIDESCLRCLPEDDIPVELLSIVRQSTDVQVVDQESEGYVPDHGDVEDDVPGEEKHETIMELCDENDSDISEEEHMGQEGEFSYVMLTLCS
ncbi:hypothetical protein M413DRAFT_258503 [Hebeloma cylindrosporum]|uniref:DUF6570 domain-containing protein n=1 Tax=Hebeloma cylindrosporum TaxID=76867 RepID=A0A0C2XIJ7_HEBCY|nr:hypothetical protein M413DRAFT_258503 [Hebeloma cylindrosporum h7]